MLDQVEPSKLDNVAESPFVLPGSKFTEMFDELQKGGYVKEKKPMTERDMQQYKLRWDQLQQILGSMHWTNRRIEPADLLTLASTVTQGTGIPGANTEVMPFDQLSEVATEAQQFATSFDVMTPSHRLRFKLVIDFVGQATVQVAIEERGNPGAWTDLRN